MVAAVLPVQPECTATSSGFVVALHRASWLTPEAVPHLVRESAPTYGCRAGEPGINEVGADDSAIDAVEGVPHHASDDAPADLLPADVFPEDVLSENVGIPDAGTVHALLKSLHATGNEVRLRPLEALRILHDHQLCYELGYSSVHQYCDRELGFARSTVLEYLRGSVALDELPRLRALFGQGELSWQQVRAITRVATPGSEIQWIELAWEVPVRELLAEVQESRRSGRDAPREKRHGLPNLITRICIDLTLEEKERVRAAFARVSEALDGDPSLVDGAGLASGDEDHTRAGRARPDPRPALVRWADGILSGAIPAGPGAGRGPGSGRGTAVERPTPAQTVLYQQCPACHSATVATEDGPVRVSSERVAELAPFSNSVEITPEEERVADPLRPGDIDAPNSPRLARQVLHRDGLRCGNPGCANPGRGSPRNLQAHHIVFRARGGRTALSNEVAVCDRCHAMLHAGLLEVSGSPGHVLATEGLIWKPRPRSPGVRVRDAEALRARLRAIARARPLVPVVARAASASGSEPASRMAPPSTRVDTSPRLKELASALTKLGFSKADSEHRVRAAAAVGEKSCGAQAVRDDDAAILRRALRQGG